MVAGSTRRREGDGDELGKVALDLLRILQRMVGEIGGGGSGGFLLPVVGPQSNRLIQHNLDGVCDRGRGVGEKGACFWVLGDAGDAVLILEGDARKLSVFSEGQSNPPPEIRLIDRAGAPA